MPVLTLRNVKGSELTWTEVDDNFLSTQSQGLDIPSASNIDLTASTGNVVDVTGTTTITSITLAAGYQRIVRFTGALTLVHSANLMLPNSSNITTISGDYAYFVGAAGNIVRCVFYSRTSSVPDFILLKAGIY